jgi:hypothetical protein
VEPLQRQRMVRPLGRAAARLTVVIGALLATALTGCGGSTPPPAPTSGSPTSTSSASTASTSAQASGTSSTSHKLVSCGSKDAPGSEPTQVSGLFSPDSVWNRPDVAQKPAGDPVLAQELANEAESETKQGIGPWIETNADSTPVYVVGADQKCVSVAVDTTGASARALSTAFERVPLPRSARPAAGPDAHLTLIQPSTDSMWEFWKLRKAGDQWRAGWGGAIHNLSSNPGYYTSGAWPGAQSDWGASATSLPVLAGTMTIGELESGHIDHALAIAIPNAREGVFAFPAQRTDGTLGTSQAIPEGTTFRLDPKLDVQALHLPRVVEMMAEAAQRYGIIVRDKTLHAIGFYAEDPTPLGTNPYTRLFDGKSPGELLQSFPWSHLQVVKPTLKSSSA